MRRVLALAVPVIVLAAGLVLFLVGRSAEEDAREELVMAEQAADEQAAEADRAQRVDRRLRAVRRLVREASNEADEVRTAAAEVVARSREDIAAMERLVVALRSRDFDGYNAGIVVAGQAGQRREDSLDPYSGDGAQLNGIANEIDAALDAAQALLDEGG